MSHPPVQIVNEFDEPLYGAGLVEKALPQELIRRVVHIFVFDREGRVFLQKRGGQVLDAGLLDISASGHVNEGQTYPEAAAMEMREELGVEPQLSMHGTYYGQYPSTKIPGKIERFWAGVFSARLGERDDVVTDGAEVAGGTWYTIPKLQDALASEPHRFTKSVPLSFAVYRTITTRCQRDHVRTV